MISRTKAWLMILLFTFSCIGSWASEKTLLEASPRTETEALRLLMIGNWYGERKDDQGNLNRTLTKRRADGTFIVHFRVEDANGQVQNYKEAGIWGVRKPIYFTATRAFEVNDRFRQGDTNDASLYDAYEILELNNVSFVYYSLTSGNTFRMKRVADDFVLEAAQIK